ncbi:hypothetical protein M0412_12970 [Agrobacterium sp. O3.4]|uniref:Uncharacterized protein n=2 Tax=Rhizobium/Agrobacterium group TaxID=227290 RepID=A0A546XGG5_RHIRH|nr:MULTISPECIES: hypothetical protein [Rhizobium/Agrobacterium group]MCZ7468595.1 hypothetical protein [Rhizobium rhizogenes]TRA99828.1 hypothetical protein EXN68_15385 [Rhizobium rhizogenes]WHO10685.1 hypothetical protein KZ699_19515 [Agrobacterium cucumeris]
MRFLQILSAICISSVSTAYAADEVPTAQGLLENICIGSRLDEKLLEPFVKQTAAHFGAKSMKMEADMLPSVNPDATSGWLIGKDDRSFAIAFAKKIVDGMPSISCSIVTQADDKAVADLRTHIETTYKTRKIADQKQGGTTIAVYSAELLGFSSPKNFSVQQVHAGPGLDGMVMVSFFDSSAN